MLLDNFLTKNKASAPQNKRNSLHRAQILDTLHTLRSIKVVKNKSNEPENVEKRTHFSKQDSNSTQSTDKDTSKINLRPTKPFDRHIASSKVASLSPVRALESQFPIAQMKASLEPRQQASPKAAESSALQETEKKGSGKTEDLQEIIDRMSLPAVQARRDKPEKVSFRRPTQNPPSKRFMSQEHESRRRDEQMRRTENKKKLIQQKGQTGA